MAAAIGVFIKGRDMGSLVEDMQSAVAKEVQLPPGYSITWGGEFENQQRAMGRLVTIIPVSILLIFILLFEAFKTVKSAALILLLTAYARNRKDNLSKAERNAMKQLLPLLTSSYPGGKRPAMPTNKKMAAKRSSTRNRQTVGESIIEGLKQAVAWSQGT